MLSLLEAAGFALSLRGLPTGFPFFPPGVYTVKTWYNFSHHYLKYTPSCTPTYYLPFTFSLCFRTHPAWSWYQEYNLITRKPNLRFINWIQVWLDIVAILYIFVCSLLWDWKKQWNWATPPVGGWASLSKPFYFLFCCQHVARNIFSCKYSTPFSSMKFIQEACISSVSIRMNHKNEGLSFFRD